MTTGILTAKEVKRIQDCVKAGLMAVVNAKYSGESRFMKNKRVTELYADYVRDLKRAVFPKSIWTNLNCRPTEQISDALQAVVEERSKWDDMDIPVPQK